MTWYAVVPVLCFLAAVGLLVVSIVLEHTRARLAGVTLLIAGTLGGISAMWTVVVMMIRAYS